MKDQELFWCSKAMCSHSGHYLMSKCEQSTGMEEEFGSSIWTAWKETRCVSPRPEITVIHEGDYPRL